MPPRLFVVMNSSITLTEIEKMENEDPKEFWIYYYYLKAIKKKEARQMKDMEHNMKKGQQKHKTVSFPRDFVSQINKKVINLEDE